MKLCWDEQHFTFSFTFFSFLNYLSALWIYYFSPYCFFHIPNFSFPFSYSIVFLYSCFLLYFPFKKIFLPLFFYTIFLPLFILIFFISSMPLHMPFSFPHFSPHIFSFILSFLSLENSNSLSICGFFCYCCKGSCVCFCFVVFCHALSTPPQQLTRHGQVEPYSQPAREEIPSTNRITTFKTQLQQDSPNDLTKVHF